MSKEILADDPLYILYRLQYLDPNNHTTTTSILPKNVLSCFARHHPSARLFVPGLEIIDTPLMKTAPSDGDTISPLVDQPSYLTISGCKTRPFIYC